MNLSIVLPIYNEEKIIEKSILEIINPRIKFCDNIEILAINDGSRDNTLHILESLAKQDKRIKIISHNTNMGYGAALRSGIKNARWEWIFFTDADMQFNVSELKAFLPFINGLDFIVGYRKNRADSLKRKFISYIYNKLVKILFKLPLRDVDCAFKLMKKSSLANVKFFSDSFFVSVELMVKSFQKGYRIKEVGVNHYPRVSGTSKVTYGKILLSLIDLVKLYKSIYL